MSVLNTTPNISDPDEFYALLISAHDGKTESESEAYNARLILLLANHIGDSEILNQALVVAQSTLPPTIKT